MILQIFFVLSGCSWLTQGKECRDISRPHQTRCDLYYKCVVLPSKTIAWVLTNCKQGLTYDNTSKICVVPDEDWKCNIGDNSEPTKMEENSVGATSLEYLNKEIESYPKRDVIGETISFDGETYNRRDEQKHISSEEDDDKKSNKLMETEVNESDEIDCSGNGSDDENEKNVKKEDTYIAISINSKPSNSVANHLQKLSQLIQSLSNDSQSKIQNYELGPNDLNNFLLHHNIKTEYNDHKKTQQNKLDIPMDGQIHPQYLAEILDLQQKLQSLNSHKRDEYPTTTTEHSFGLEKYSSVSTTLPKSPVHVKAVRIADPEYSSSQVVINRPEGSVFFSLPNSIQPDDQSSHTPSPSPLPSLQQQQQQQEPYVSQDTLKTVLELSKQLLSSTNHYQAIQNYINGKNYYEPIFGSNDEKESKHYGNEDQDSSEPNYIKLTSVSGFIDTAPKYHQENGDVKPSIIHNHIIPIRIKNPFPQSIQEVSTSAPPVTVTTVSGVNHQFDDFKYPMYADVDNSRPYPEYNGYSSYTMQQWPNANIQNYIQPSQPYRNQYYRDHQYPVNEFLQSVYTQQTHLNDNNVNNFVNFNTPQYPTLRPTSPSSSKTTDSVYPNHIYSATPKVQPININQQELINTELATIIAGLDEDNNEYDSNDNEDYETNAPGINEYNVMNLLADLQNQKTLHIQNKQLTEHAPINPLLIGANEDSKGKVVHFGDMSIDEYEKLVQPLIIDEGAFSNTVDVITCVTGARQALAKDCTKYTVCNGDTGKEMTYSCPPYTAFNEQSRFCDAKTFRVCRNEYPNSSDVIIENERLQVNKDVKLAQKEREQITSSQTLSNKQTNNITNATKPNIVKRPARNRTKKIKSTSSELQPSSRTRPISKRKKNKPIIRRIACKEPSKVADSLSIYNYFTCYKGTDGTLKARKMTCPVGLVFCARIRLCTSTARCAT